MNAAPPLSSAAILDPLVGPFERALDTAVRHRGFPLNLEEAIRYATGGGGKRLRPMLVLLAARAAGGDERAAMPAAVALELVHTFSLVHDDLPAMDDDAVRRGRPTLHVQAGETMAILAGDAMTALAFEVLAAANLSAETRVGLVGELAVATGSMISGQVYDNVGGFPHELSPEQRLAVLHRGKTGALFRAACRMGGICAGAGSELMECLTAYGSAAGLMFQVTDDLIDVEQGMDHAGKATGKDASAGKLTYPGVHGVTASRDTVERLLISSIEALEPLGEGGRELRVLVEDMARRTR
jgi:geranylgeranyl diphosphate synthase type II